ncbi:MAG TPA: group II intron maturase-specific domain-containing protein [Patescibacteria group bacterium]|nr:group II intron maturase-specific domain-containing protein [Patescibacteria group bacterium]
MPVPVPVARGVAHALCANVLAIRSVAEMWPGPHPRFGFMPRVEIPTDKRADIWYKVKQLTTRSTIGWSLPRLLQKLNPILQDWGNYFRFCTGASDLFADIDHYVGDRIWRWLMKKHQSLGQKKTTIRRLPSRLRPTRRAWREGGTEQFLLSSLKVVRRHGKLIPFRH